MASVPSNPTQLTPPRVALIDERSGAISREWYRFFLSLLNATESNQQETELSPDTSSLLASYDAMLTDLAQTTETQPEGASVSALAVTRSDIQSLALAPPNNSGTVTSVAASGGTTGLTFTGSPITTSGTLTLSGTLAVANGGTGQTSYTDGQLLIGNTTGNTLTLATLTAGSGVSITNGAGAITINATGTGGTVTSVSVVSANGLAGTVANATTTPAITLSTSVTGIVKGNGTALSAAVAATDYVAPGAYTTSGLTMATARILGRTTASTGAAEEITIGTGLLLSAGTLSSTVAGTVTSVSGTGTVNGITLTGTVTSSGSLTLGGTLSGVSLTTQVSGTLPVANGGTGQTSYTDGQLLIGNTTGNTLTKATLTAGTNVSITNGAGAITINAADAFVGTVTSVSGTGTVNGITLTGTVTSSGSLTLGGTLSGVSLTTQVSGTLPVANGGTGVTSSTGTVAVVLSTSPTLITPILGAATATSIANGLGLVGTPSYTFTGDLNTGMWSPAADTVAVSTAGAECLRIGSDGNVLMGTSSSIFSGSVRLEIKAASSNHATIAVVETSGFVPYIAWNQATTGDNNFMAFGTEAAYTGRGSISYNRTAGLVSYNTTSDYRAKEVFGPIETSGATIDSLKVYTGKMLGATQSRPMLVAHEAQAVAPYAVTGEKDAVNEDGTPHYQQMDVSALVPLLIAEVQSLRARVAQLEGK
jgi:hypothetical protein